jgi:hypothetical protein
MPKGLHREQKKCNSWFRQIARAADFSHALGVVGMLTGRRPHVLVVITSGEALPAILGEKIRLKPDPKFVHLFDAETGKRLSS